MARFIYPAILVLAFFSSLHQIALGQLLKQVEQEFILLAENAKRCCVKVEIQIQKEIAFEVKQSDASGGKETSHVELSTVKGLNSLSGVLLDQEGHVATLGEAIPGAVRISVSLYNGERYKARVIGYSLDSNVGLLKIQEKPSVDPLPLGNSDSIRPGAIVMALGYSYNLQPSPSCAVGIVSATDRAFRFRTRNKILKNLFQASIPLHPGEMGGPIVNTSSEVVGLLLTAYTPVPTAAQRGTLGQRGCTIVMPINRLREEVAWILAQHERGSPMAKNEEGGVWLGLSADEIEDQALRNQLGIPKGGVLVSHIYPDDPAALAGIKENDVLKEWNRDLIEGIAHLRKLVEGAKAGDKVQLLVIRRGKPINLEIQLGTY